MNVGSPREDSKAASNNSPPGSVGDPSNELAKFEKDEIGSKDEEGEDTKMSPKTAAATKDALAEPQDKPAAAVKGKKKRSWKKPEGMPKRPLSAYNLFFKEQRQELLGEEVSSAFPVTDQTKRKHRKSHGKVGFQEMASIIGKKWKALSPAERKTYEDVAAIEKAKYKEKVERWRSGEDDVESEVEEGGYDSSSRREGQHAAMALSLPRGEAADFAMADLSVLSRHSSFGSAHHLSNPAAVAATMGQRPFDRLTAAHYGVQTQAAASMMSSQAGLSESGRMMMQGVQGSMDPERMMFPSSAGLSGEADGGRLNHLQRMYELRVREAAMLREEMQRSLATGGTALGSSLPGQGLQRHIGQVSGDARPNSVLGMGQSNQPPQGLQPNPMGQRRMSLGTSMGGSIRSVPAAQQQQPFPNDYYMFSPGGQEQQLLQAEESWQNQLALGNPGVLPQVQPQQQRATDPVTALREQRARLLQQALENDRAFRDEELQRFLRRQSGPGGGI